MAAITAILGDITTQRVDAIVNAANRQMRGGGGVDGAIHRAGGPEILADCVARFPDGLATGDAGYTTAGAMPATWVIHTVGPNYGAGEQDPKLLRSCYRRSLAIADELGARSVAFPLISAGVYRWPLRDAVEIAVRTLIETPSDVEEIRLVAFNDELHRLVRAELRHRMILNLLRAVRVLHERGYQSARVLPGMSPSGMHWRVDITDTAVPLPDVHVPGLDEGQPTIRYTTGDDLSFADAEVSATTTPDELADLILRALPSLAPVTDALYADWYAGLLDLVLEHSALPVAYADEYRAQPGWQIGWGSGLRYSEPPN